MSKQTIPLSPEQFKKAKRAERMIKTSFPFSNFQPEIADILKIAMVHNSMFKVGCSFETWKKLCLFGEQHNYSVADAELVINVILAATPIEMKQSLADNIKMIEFIQPTRDLFNGAHENVMKEVNRELEVLSRIQIPNKKIIS